MKVVYVVGEERVEWDCRELMEQIRGVSKKPGLLSSILRSWTIRKKKYNNRGRQLKERL